LSLKKRFYISITSFRFYLCRRQVQCA